MRGIVSLIYLLTIIPFIFIRGNFYYYLTIWVSLVMFFAVTEYFNLIDLKKSAFKYLGYVFAGICIGIYGTFKIPIVYQNYYLGTIISLMLIISVLIVVLKYDKYTFSDVAKVFFGYIYTIILPMYILRLTINASTNRFLVLLFVIVVSTDTFGYLVGKKFGKHHFTKISPKKTIEGSIGGMVAAIVISSVTVLLLNMKIRFATIPLILLLSIISQIGDLLASLIKREYGKKDFSNILKSHGGIIDRVDALIFTAPFLYMVMTLF